MPDISKCDGVECPMKETCYRYTCKPGEFMQSYFTAPPVKDGECDYRWPVQKGD